MKPSPTTARTFVLLLVALPRLVGPSSRPPAQLPTSEERLKILTDPEDVKKKLEKDKEKARPPIEMSLSQIAPFDVLPYVKANHWSTISLELRANYDDYAGSLQTAPVPLIGLPQEIVYRRDARLAKSAADAARHADAPAGGPQARRTPRSRRAGPARRRPARRGLAAPRPHARTAPDARRRPDQGVERRPTPPGTASTR